MGAAAAQPELLATVREAWRERADFASAMVDVVLSSMYHSAHAIRRTALPATPRPVTAYALVGVARIASRYLSPACAAARRTLPPRRRAFCLCAMRSAGCAVARDAVYPCVVRKLVTMAIVATTACGRVGFEPSGQDASPRVVPSNGLEFDPAATGALAIASRVDIDVDSGAIITDGGLELRAPGLGVISGITFTHADRGGAPIGVFTVESLEIAVTGWLIARGERAVAVLATKTMAIYGEFDVSANRGRGRVQAGPGGGNGGGTPTDLQARGCGNGGNGVTIDIDGIGGGEPGGGGGGHASVGGRGGEAQLPTGGPGTSGRICGAAELEPLLGGSGGGAGGMFMMEVIGGAGGGGGGAVQLTAGSEVFVAASALIAANGAGG